jgi:hypothetical protein
MIGGFIITGGNPIKILVRALGPSLSSAGISNPLVDPTLELRNAQGTKIAENNNWQMASNASDIQATGVAPKDARESAILIARPAGNTTALVRGAGNTTGVALVEVYQIP